MFNVEFSLNTLFLTCYLFSSSQNNLHRERSFKTKRDMNPTCLMSLIRSKESHVRIFI